MWYDDAIATQDQGSDVGNVRAQMAGRGMRPGTPEWDQAIAEVRGNRPNVGAEYAAKQADLQSSLVYQDLNRAYMSDEGRRRDAWNKKMFGTGKFGMTNEAYNPDATDRWGMTQGMPERKQDMFGAWNRGMTTDEAMTVDAYAETSFEDWGNNRFGAVNVDNTYNSAPSAEDSATARAKTAARGRAPGSAGTGVSVSMIEENPWM